MGLDYVELVMEFEDEFDVQIPDAVATEMCTVGDSVETILSLLRQRPHAMGVCQTARSFYRLRSELHQSFGIPRHRIKPGSRLAEFELERVPRREWSKVADAAGLRREPNVLCKRRFPPPAMSVRWLVKSRCKPGYRRFDGSIDEESVFALVRQIVSEQLGIPPEKISRDSRYIDDLHVD
jgi:acyl carrier protein